MEKFLWEYPDLGRQLLEAAPVVIVVVDPGGVILHANPYFGEITGYQPDNVKGRDWFRTFVPEADHARVRELFAQCLAGQGARGVVSPIVTREGVEREIEWTDHLLPDSDGNTMAVMRIGQDVTERVREQQRRTSRLEEANQLANLGVWELNLDTGDLWWSPEMYRIYGADPAVTPSQDLFFSLVHPDDRAMLEAGIEAAHTRPATGLSYRIVRPDGRVRQLFGQGTVELDDAGRPVRLRGTNLDITDWLESADALRLSEKRYQQLVASSPYSIVELDRDHHFVSVNPAAATLLGVEAGDAVGKPYRNWVVENERDRVDELIRLATVSRAIEVDFTCVNHRLLRSSFRETPNGTIMAITVDLTESRAEETRLRQILDSLFVFVGLFDTDLRLIEANQAPLEFGGVRREDVIGARFSETIWWSHSAAVREELERQMGLARDGEVVRYDTTAMSAEGEPHDLDITFSPIRDDTGEVVQLVGCASDVTGERAIRRELRDTAERLLAVMDATHEGIFEVDLATGARKWSDRMIQLVGRDVSDQPFDPHDTAIEMIHPDDREMAEQALRHALETGEAFNRTFRMSRADGAWFWAEISAKTIPAMDGRNARLIGSVRDVTARIRSERALADSLREKETLLREIHHRVKNNLQIVSSMLHFQAKKVGEDAREPFEDLRRRIQAISLVHEALYRSTDLSTLDLGEYVRSVLRALAASFGPPAVSIRFDSPDPPVSLTIEHGLPIGLILCELITNIYKHAWPDGQRGTARVAVEPIGSRIRMRVSDDGVGLPGSFDSGSERSFGWQLVRSLVKQIGGALATRNDGGAVVEIEMPAS